MLRKPFTPARIASQSEAFVAETNSVLSNARWEDGLASPERYHPAGIGILTSSVVPHSRPSPRPARWPTQEQFGAPGC